MERSGTGSKKRACDSCHRRKIQCDRCPPQCNWCKCHGLVCTFDRPFGRRKRTRKSSPADGTRMAPSSLRSEEYTIIPPSVSASDMSSTLPPPAGEAKTDPINAGAPTELAGPPPYAGLGGFYFDGFHLGGISSQDGVPFFSERGINWIRARAGSAPVLRATEPPSQDRGHGQRLPPQIEGTWELPDRSMVEAYFGIFFSSALRYVFPIIDDASFMGIVDRAYDAREDARSIDVTRAKACVLSFTGILIHMEGKLDSHQAVDNVQCIARAERLIPHILVDANSESLQVFAMLAMYHLYSGNVAAAGTFLSIACRFALMLGAQLRPANPAPTTQDAESNRLSRVHLRGLFWLCYMFDKDMCLRAGYPPVIDDDHCDMTLPRGYKEIDDFDSFKDGSDIFPGDMRLSIIKSHAIRLLYCARAFQNSNAGVLRAIRELDDELEAWRLSIPPLHRPTLAPAYRIHLQPSFNKAKKVHLIVINLEYYFLLALLHSASGRCRTWTSDAGDQAASITSSQALALQASRSTITNLAAVSDVFNCGDFLARDDTLLLRRVPGLIRGLRVQRMSAGETARVERVEEFILELIRLAELAITRRAADVVSSLTPES